MTEKQVIPDFTDTIVQGEVNNYAGVIMSATPVTISTATWQLYDNSGNPISGYGGNVMKFDPPGVVVNAWMTLDSTSLAPGTYDIVFTITLADSRVKKPVVRVIVTET